MPIYFIEGNIGTGKSTFLSMIETLFPENQVIYEPIDIWSSFTDEYGNSILDYFYKDQKRYAYTFQSLAFISRIEKISEIDIARTMSGLSASDTCAKNIFIERSIWSDSNVFARNCALNGTLTPIEYKLYKRWFTWAENMVKESLKDAKFVYLRCNPDTSLNRINIRDRKAERGIPKEYITQIHLRHEEWMNDIPEDKRITIDVNDIDIKDPEVFREMFTKTF